MSPGWGTPTSHGVARAWAIFELGPKAAAAAGPLARALADPAVRMPALHAIESIGPDAVGAVPRVAALLEHPDAFVRLGATFALGGIGRPRAWDQALRGYSPDDASPHGKVVAPALRRVLGDDSKSILMAAGFGLFCCGADAAPALPEAMALLQNDDGTAREAGMRVLCGIGPGAAAAVPRLVELYVAATGSEPIVARTLAAIGPAAADALAALEKYANPENRYLADTYYALSCIRGDAADFEKLARMLEEKQSPQAEAERTNAARFLNALGAAAASVAPLVRDKLTIDPKLKKGLEAAFLKKVEEGEGPIRLLPR